MAHVLPSTALAGALLVFSMHAAAAPPPRDEPYLGTDRACMSMRPTSTIACSACMRKFPPRPAH